MTDSENEDPKIIVDSDWKEQVAKEKQAAAEQAIATETGATETTDNEGDNKTADNEVGNDDLVPKQPESASEEAPSPPPATFEILISMMFTQAMSMLGQIPDPSGEMMPVNKPYAKHTIDTLEMLGEKTKGNLSDEESNMLSEALHALRMAYVNTKA